MALHASRLLGALDLARGDPEGQLARAQKTWEWVCRTGVRDRQHARGFVGNGLNDMGRTREALELAEINIREARDRSLSPNAWVSQQIGVARLGLALGEWARVAIAVDDIMTDTWGGDIGAIQRSTVATLRARQGDLAGARQLRDQIPEAPPDAPPGIEGSAETGWRALASLEIAILEDDLSGVRAVCRYYDEATLPGDVPLDLWMTHAQGLRIAGRDGRNGARTFVTDSQTAIASRPPGGPIPQACRAEIDAHADRVGNRDSAEQWAAAAAHWAGMERVYDEGWCHLFEAECALRDGDRERGERLLRETWELCCRLREVPLRRKVESAARASGIEGIGDPEPPSSTSSALTHREHEVLALIADGRTNAEIAATLVISQKTASVHVSHIIAKLGVGNRTEAAAYAHRQGLATRRA
jgi:DNA-binding CsgD family transcriptional regulator